MEVTGAAYGSCNGEYDMLWYSRPESPDKPVYKHASLERYLIYHPYPGYGWSFVTYRSATGYYHSSHGEY